MTQVVLPRLAMTKLVEQTKKMLAWDARTKKMMMNLVIFEVDLFKFGKLLWRYIVSGDFRKM